MKELAQDLLNFLLAFFGVTSETLTKATADVQKRFTLACKVFLLNPHLSFYVEKGEKNSEHTTTAHNADSTQYILVRDDRIPQVPLRLQPVESKGKTLSYVTVMDTEKGLTLKQCSQYASLYMAKTLKGKKSFHALTSSLFCRQANEDIINNTRQRESAKASQYESLCKMAQAFVNLPDEAWLAMKANEAFAETQESLIEVVEELRSATLEAN
jgi:hypothetical protein